MVLQIKAKIKKIIKLNSDVSEFEISFKENFNFTSGQFVMLSFDNKLKRA